MRDSRNAKVHDLLLALKVEGWTLDKEVSLFVQQALAEITKLSVILQRVDWRKATESRGRELSMEHGDPEMTYLSNASQ